MPGVGLLAASYAGCDRPVVVALFCLGMAMMGPFYCSLKVNALDISPNYSGLVMSIVNGLGAVSGIISPDIVGLLIPNVSACMHAAARQSRHHGVPDKRKTSPFFLQRTLKQWRDVFWVTFGVCLFSSVVYCVFSSAEVQPWNSVGEGGEFLEDAAHPAAASTPEKEKRRASEAAKV